MTNPMADPMTKRMTEPMINRMTNPMTDPLTKTKTMTIYVHEEKSVQNCDVKLAVFHSCDVFTVLPQQTCRDGSPKVAGYNLTNIPQCCFTIQICILQGVKFHHKHHHN